MAETKDKAKSDDHWTKIGTQQPENIRLHLRRIAPVRRPAKSSASATTTSRTKPHVRPMMTR